MRPAVLPARAAQCNELDDAPQDGAAKRKHRMGEDLACQVVHEGAKLTRANDRIVAAA